MGSGVKRAFFGVVTTLIVLVVAIAGVFAFHNRQAIDDHFTAQAFNASPGLTELAASLNLTTAGERVFYASHPTLDASQRFNEQCANVEHSEEGYILGCYTKKRIHLFKVTDDRLAGIVEVTAAHELLHAVFWRLDRQDRTQLIERLGLLYEELAAEDPAIAQRMSVYSSLPEAAFANELFSVLGTEVRNLPEWLEQTYSEWFRDRSVILDFFDSYHSVFDDLKQRSTQLQDELAALREGVELRGASYSAAVEQFNADWQSFLDRNAAYEFSDDPDEFYRLRDEFYERRDWLSAELAALNADIARHEELRAELAALSSLNNELEQHLDSDFAPPAPAPLD